MSVSATEIEIRRMTSGDVPRAIEIADGLQQAPHYSLEVWLKLLEPASEPPQLVLVAAETESGAVQGFAVAARLLPAAAELEAIAVAAGSQRRGLGRRLLQAAVDELRRAGIQEVWLEVRASNHPALELYRSFGFHETGRRSRYYRDPVEDAVLMSLGAS